MSSGDNRTPLLMSVQAGMASGATVAVALRFYTRIRITRSVRWDDWFMLLAVVSLPTASTYLLLPPYHLTLALSTKSFNHLTFCLLTSSSPGASPAPASSPRTTAWADAAQTSHPPTSPKPSCGYGSRASAPSSLLPSSSSRSHSSSCASPPSNDPTATYCTAAWW